MQDYDKPMAENENWIQILELISKIFYLTQMNCTINPKTSVTITDI